jgi:mono/diheme cytochrome c family protein
MMSARSFFRPGRLFGLAGVLFVTVSGLAADQGRSGSPARTAKDAVYTEAQATAGKALFEKFCASCHGFKPSEKSNLTPDLGGESFLTTWNGRSLKELQTTILTTMPNDGSAVLTEAQTVETVAYILQQNGFPAGAQPLGAGEAAAAITIVK